MKLRPTFLTLALTALSAGVARGQQPQPSAPPQQGSDDVPKASRPPAGMCRIWLDKVPAKQQPAPTDCPTAVKNKPANGKVLFGDDYEKGKKPESKEPPFLKKFSDDRRKP